MKQRKQKTAFIVKETKRNQPKAILLTVRIIVALFILFPAAENVYAQNITRVAGIMKTACPATPCGDGGQATAATLYAPDGLSIDADDNIYIAEYSNHTIRKINKTTGIITTIAGVMRTPCTTTPCGDNGPAVSARLNGPRGLTNDAAGNLYFADFSNHAVRKVDKVTGVITTVAGTLRAGCATSPCGDGGQAIAAQLNNPTGVAFDPDGNMHIADYGNHVIRRVDKNTGIITTVAGTSKISCVTVPCGDGGLATAAFLNGPSTIDFDTNGNLYIAEYGSHAIRKVNKATGIISTVAGTLRTSCVTSPCGDGGLATAATLNGPFGVTIDINNNIFIADASNAAVRKVDNVTGIISTVAGKTRTSCSVAPCGEGGLATAALLSNPFAVAFNSENVLYIVEYSNQVVRKVGSESVLPVRLSDARAYQRNDIVEVSWKAAAEVNIEKYIIEKSPNGLQFFAAGEVAARGNGVNDVLYNWVDNHPVNGDSYYRILTMEKDGAKQYSAIMKLSIGSGPGILTISPNPVINKTVSFQVANVPAGRYELVLFNNFGQKVYNKTMMYNGGSASENIQLPMHLNNGIYTLRVKGNKQELVKKLIIQ